MIRRGFTSAGKQVLLLTLGIFTLIAALYQNFALELPYFYALFSVGMNFLLYALYRWIALDPLFDRWGAVNGIIYIVLLIAACVVIDQIGMALGYWEYPHYGSDDVLRKYLFEWAAALFYHLLSLFVGMQLFKRLGTGKTASLILSMLLIVTPVGVLTEYLNLHVYSWRVLSMPLTNFRIGEYFIVFQTVGYWLMAIIPYLLYLLADSISAGNRAFRREVISGTSEISERDSATEGE